MNKLNINNMNNMNKLNINNINNMNNMNNFTSLISGQFSPTAKCVHTYYDGSKLMIGSIFDILEIPVWKGNRNMDQHHVAEIEKKIGMAVESLDSGYKIVEVPEEDATGKIIHGFYLVDGQHRMEVIRRFNRKWPMTLNNFPVTFTVKLVANEDEIITHFNTINTSKPILFKEDDNMLINKVIQGMVSAFNGGGKLCIRQTRTRTPYMSFEDLRALLKGSAVVGYLRTDGIDRFIEYIRQWNNERCERYRCESIVLKESELNKTHEKAYDLHFFISCDHSWVGMGK
jgi:hypothetical protein